jgi:uncharacterized membrane protein HdeD (DUF308 family)
MLAESLSRYWWMTLLRGVLWILFGIVLFTRPFLSLVTLTLLFGAFVFADGIMHVVHAFGGRRENERWWVTLLTGLCGIAVGILTFLNPGVTAFALLLYIAIWAIVTGLFEIISAVRLRQEIEGEFWLILAGLLSVAFGVLLLARPGAGALSVVWLIGGYAVAFGVVLIVLAFEARGYVHRAVTTLKG